MTWFLFLTLLTTQGPIVFESLTVYNTEDKCKMDAGIIGIDYAGNSSAKIEGFCITEEQREELRNRVESRLKASRE